MNRQERRAGRLQRRAARRSSALGPVLLVTLGVALLGLQAGVPVVALLAKWWPLLMVGAGLILLLEWVQDSRSLIEGSSQGYVPRRRLGPLGGLLLATLLGAGVLASVLAHHAMPLDHAGIADFLAPWGLHDFFGQQREEDVQFDAPLHGAALLTIENRRGNIDVTGSSLDGRIHVVAHQRLWAWGARELERRYDKERPRLESSGTGLTLRVPSQGGDHTDLTIQVPHEMALEITGQQGDVSLRELRGNVHLYDHKGAVSVSALTGDLEVTMRDDDGTVSAHGVTGEVSVSGRAGDLAFSDVHGKLALAGDFFGSTRLEQISGPVSFKTSFTDLRCEAIPGSLTVEGRSALTADRITGPVSLRTSDRDITLNGITHGASVVNAKGSVTVSLQDPLDPVSLSTSEGTLDVRMPPSSGFDVDAETRNGDIESQLGFEPEQDGKRVTLRGKHLAGGPLLTLRTSDGDIKVRLVNSATEDGNADKSDDSQ